MMKRARTFRCCRTPGRFALAAALLLVISACATRAPAPIEDRSIPSPQAKRTAPASPPAVKPPPAHTAESDARPQTYTVKRGDTLHLIALDHGLDYRELAAWNGIQNVDVIRVGQVLRLGPPGDAVASTTTTTGSGVTTAPLKSAAPIVAGGAAPPPTANGGGTAGAPPGANPAQGAAAAPTLSPAPVPERAPAPVVTSRNSDTYKTQPKAAKEPYSERALREMQQRFQGSTAVASNASSLGGSAAPAASSAAAPNSSSPEVAMPAASAPSPSGSPAPAPQVIARADTKLDSKPAAPATADEDDDNKLDWTWPTAGKLVTGFSDTANLKGIDIAGKTGQPVLASAAGKVVYAGSGLRGYGKLIIIKHNKNYLSAYAHNKDILVKEGQQVTRGQKIAEMGNTDADQVKLHFEIRRLGKPMDPLKFLPPAS